MDYPEMVKMSEKERASEVEKLQKKLYGLRLKARLGEEKKNHLVRETKRNIARLKTAQSSLRTQTLLK